MSEEERNMEVEYREGEVFSTLLGKNMAAIENGEDDLHDLDKFLRIKQASQSLTLDESDEETDESDAVITESAGSVGHIRGIFQGLAVGEQAEKSHSGEEATCFNEPSEMTQSVKPNKDTLLRRAKALKHSESKQTNGQCDKHGERVNHDKGKCFDGVDLRDETSKVDQESAKSKTPKTPKNKKKRKLNSGSAEKDEKENQLSVNADAAEATSLFPIFTSVKQDGKANGDSDNESGRQPNIKTRLRSADKRKTVSESGEKEDPWDEISEQNLEVLDVRTVLKMVKSMRKDVNDARQGFQQDMQKVKGDIKKDLDSTKSKMKKENEIDIQAAFKHYEEEIKELRKELREQKHKTHLVSGILQLNQGITADLTKRISSLELESYRKSVILTGLSFSTKKDTRNEQLQTFFNDAMGVRINVDDSYFLGSGTKGKKSKPVVAVLETLKDKNKLFQKKEILAQLEGEDGRPIYLNSYLPPEINEKKGETGK